MLLVSHDDAILAKEPHGDHLQTLSKGRGDQDQSREHGKSPTSVDQPIGREDVGLADTEPPQPLWGCQKWEPDEICAGVDDWPVRAKKYFGPIDGWVRAPLKVRNGGIEIPFKSRNGLRSFFEELRNTLLNIFKHSSYWRVTSKNNRINMLPLIHY